MIINENNIDLGLYLSEWFDFYPEDEIYKSKRKQLGVSAGDDKTLYILIQEGFTIIYWKYNRGGEETIFDGAQIKTPKVMKKVFKLLGINEYKIFKKTK